MGLVGDVKFQDSLSLHVQARERMAQAALHVEILVYAAFNLLHEWYIGRSQYQRVDEVPAVPARRAENKYTAPVANFWIVFPRLLKYMWRSAPTISITTNLLAP